jgi:hypothetical protein
VRTNASLGLVLFNVRIPFRSGITAKLDRNLPTETLGCQRPVAALTYDAIQTSCLAKPWITSDSSAAWYLMHCNPRRSLPNRGEGIVA